MHDPPAERARRAAETQSLFRSVNNRVKRLNDAFGVATPYDQWACECARLECTEKIQLTRDEYEQLRRDSNSFAVAPGDEHVDPEIERVVSRTERFWVVRKVGAGAERAAELDGQRD